MFRLIPALLARPSHPCPARRWLHAARTHASRPQGLAGLVCWSHAGCNSDVLGTIEPSLKMVNLCSVGVMCQVSRRRCRPVAVAPCIVYCPPRAEEGLFNSVMSGVWHNVLTLQAEAKTPCQPVADLEMVHPVTPTLA